MAKFTCGQVGALQWVSAAAALVAAALWLSAYFVKLPDLTYDTAMFLKALKAQGRRNALAALSAAAAALLQGILIVMPTCINLG